MGVPTPQCLKTQPSNTEISERTKINISYLDAIESGSFSEIETPYLRLFLRAYAEEIGGDSQRSLEQLDSFLGTNRPKVVSAQMNDDDDDDDELDIDYSQSFSFPGKKLRQDYIIGGVLSLVLLFAIAIFQKTIMVLRAQEVKHRAKHG